MHALDNQAKKSLREIESIVGMIADKTNETRASAAFQRWLSCQGKFWKYSWNNVILMFMQARLHGFDLTRVAGATTWRSMNRDVKGDQWGKRLWILAPKFRTNTFRDKNGDEKTEQVLVGFRSVYVFDQSQTEGEELPTLDYRHHGDDNGLVSALENEYARRKIALSYVEEISAAPGAKGASYGGRVEILSSLSGAERAGTLAHELAHESLHWKAGSLDPDHSRSEKEIEAESTAAVILGAWGIEWAPSTLYLASWDGDAKKVRASMDRIARTAKSILDSILPEK